jgi:hypothetical protein
MPALQLQVTTPCNGTAAETPTRAEEIANFSAVFADEEH